MSDATPDDLLTLQQAADRLGCHYMTLYRRVRTGEIEAVLLGGSYRIRSEELERWLARRPARLGAVPTRARTRPRDWVQHGRTFHDLVMEGDGEGAVRFIERLAANGAEPVEVCERVVAPTMISIGRAWEEGRRSEAHEHRATAIVESALARMATLFARPGPRRGVVVVATPAGERHGLPALMVACALRADRWTVHYLGPDLPTSALIALAREEQATLVALSCVQRSSRHALAEAVEALAAARIPAIIGGAGVDPETALACGAAGYGCGLLDAQEEARRVAAGASAGATGAD